MSTSRFVLVSFDLDKTLFRQPTLTTAARSLGIGKKWDGLHDMSEEGRITHGQCLLSQFKLLVGMKVDDILAQVSKLETMNNIRETVEKFTGHGIHVIVTTDNPDFVCEYMVERYGFNGFVSSRVVVKDGIVTDDIGALPDKMMGITKYCARTLVPMSKVVHIGDGLNDVPIFGIVGYSIALNTDLEEVNRTASRSMKTDDLLDVYKQVCSLMVPQARSKVSESSDFLNSTRLGTR